MSINFEVIKQRRHKLIEAVKQTHSGKQGVILLAASFEHERVRFRQDSSFYYYTGIVEPAVLLMLEMSGKTTLFVPAYGDARTKWVASDVYNASQQKLNTLGIDQIEDLGKQCKSYQFSCLFTDAEYVNVIEILKSKLAQEQCIFTINPSHAQIDQKFLFEKLYTFIPKLSQQIVDITPLVAKARRTKSQAEIELIYSAVDCTMSAQEAASQLIEPDKFEYQIQAGIEFVFTESDARTAFPSIVAGGINSTILHYQANNNTLKNGDMVVVDIGAELDYYCADITRSYPVTGLFTKRQREIYQLVLETQAYIADLAKPGMWLSNSVHPNQSLHHLAIDFLNKTAYGKYFTHGIGHFLGLDVHDIGDLKEPLKEGDVFTIEPGIYIPEERLGIRIEDDYWVVQDGVMCLSHELPKEIDDIEAMMAGALDEAE